MTGPRRVLVVDDDEDVRALIVDYLEVLGFEVLQATNGLEALLQVKRHHPEAVVIDVHMPRLGGLDALPRIQKFDPATHIVVVTGRAQEVGEEALARGAHAVLGKPIVLPDLQRALGLEAPAASPPPTAAADAPAAAVTGARVLIVDDDEGVRTIFEEFLAAKGYRTRSVPDGAAALRAVVTDAADVMLLDIDMPGLSGVDALVALRAVAPELIVIMVSGTVSQELARRALDNGAFDYVVKPVDLPRLAEVIETALLLKGR